MPYWLGKLGYEKWQISEEFERLGKDQGLNLDLSNKEGDRLYGANWTNFVASCKAVIGVESGASIIDFDGLLEQRVKEYVDKNSNATFQDVEEKLLTPYEGSLELHQISPRCFEAAALKTPMVLFEGKYSGVLVPDRHFIVLKKDFSNFDEVIDKLKNHEYLQNLANTTYEEVALNPKWSYKTFIQYIDSCLEHEVSVRSTKLTIKPYSSAEFKYAVNTSLNYLIRRKLALGMQAAFLGMPLTRKALYKLWDALPRPLQQFARPIARIISR
jgi:hypothetical protein